MMQTHINNTKEENRNKQLSANANKGANAPPPAGATGAAGAGQVQNAIGAASPLDKMAPGSINKQCHFFLKGTCKKGKKCPFKHDDKKGPKQNQSNEAAVSDQSLVVGMGPTRIGRSIAQECNVPLVDFKGIELPYVEKPAPGFHLCSTVHPYNLPDVSLQVGWDTGAEGTTISAKAASVVLRAQGQLPTDKKGAFTDMGRYKDPQKFYGFADSDDSKAIKVDVQGFLRLGTGNNSDVPFGPLMCRVIPGQVDDILVSWPDLSRRGFDSYSRPGYAIFDDGTCFPVTGKDETSQGCVRINKVTLDSELEVKSNTTVIVRCLKDGLGSVSSDTPLWFNPSTSLANGLEVPEGPICAGGDFQNVMIRNNSDETILIAKGTVIGRESVIDADSDEQDLVVVLSELNNPDLQQSESKDVPNRKPSVSARGETVGLRVLTRWLLIVVAALTGWCVSQSLSGLAGADQLVSRNLLEEPTVHKYNDTYASEYRDAVCVELDGQRDVRYAHLSPNRFSKLRKFVHEFAPQLHIDGVVPSTLEGPVFDIELVPGAVPVKHSLPKYSE